MGRFNRFSERLSASKNILVQNLVAIQKNDMRSTYGLNCSILTSDANVYHIPVDGEHRINLVKELLDVRSGVASIPGWDSNDVDWVLEDICIN